MSSETVLPMDVSDVETKSLMIWEWNVMNFARSWLRGLSPIMVLATSTTGEKTPSLCPAGDFFPFDFGLAFVVISWALVCVGFVAVTVYDMAFGGGTSSMKKGDISEAARREDRVGRV